MKREQLKKQIDVAAGRQPADFVIKNARVVDVYSGTIVEGDIAIAEGVICGVGEYQGAEEFDAKGSFAAPGFIDSHIHVESAYVTPEEIGRLLTPHGGTTIIADPHEIVNVCGLTGMQYMLDAAENTVLDIKYMLPSCVPATTFENAGAVITAQDMAEPLKDERILGLAEFMDYPGVINATDSAVDRLLSAIHAGKLIDGHSPGVLGRELDAYAVAGIGNDHECSTIAEMQERISKGMYVLLRNGSACHDLENLLPGVTPENSRRCLLCSDDRQPKTILEQGHLDDHLRICVRGGLDAITAIRMASLNAAECFRLYDRGAIAPGKRADIVLLDNLTDFHVQNVFIKGEHVAENGKYLLPMQRVDASAVQGKMNVKNFSKERLRLPLRSDKVHVIDILPGGVVTGKGTATVKRDTNGEFVYDAAADIVKIAVVERHTGTGNVAVALLRGYGIQRGAVALSVAHDSHNMIVAGVSDADMEFAVQELMRQGGGIMLVNNGEIVECMPLPIAGLMSDQSGEWVDERLTRIHNAAGKTLGISGSVEPVMTLCFMSLAVIPELKLTDMGLFDVNKFDFIEIEAD